VDAGSGLGMEPHRKFDLSITPISTIFGLLIGLIMGIALGLFYRDSRDYNRADFPPVVVDWLDSMKVNAEKHLAEHGEELAKRQEKLTPPAELAFNVDAATLIGEWYENKFAAAAAYNGKWGRIDGVVGSIGSDSFGYPVVVLDWQTGWLSSWVGGGINCEYSKSDAPVLAKLRVGDRVRIAGLFEGPLTTVGHIREFNLRHCQTPEPSP